MEPTPLRSDACSPSHAVHDRGQASGPDSIGRATSGGSSQGAVYVLRMGGWLLFSLVMLIACNDAQHIENVLLISVDTLRADHLSSYDYPHNTSPRLDRFAAESVRFAEAISHSPWTTPSHMSLMTSLHPSSHTVTQGWREFVQFRDHQAGYRILPEGAVTIAELLRSHGFNTLALTGGGTVSSGLGFGQGFDVYIDGSPKLTPGTWSQISKWIADPEMRPFFIFFHTFEVHAPYIRTGDAVPLLSAEDGRALNAFVGTNPNVSEADFKKYLRENELLRPEVTSRLYDGGIRFVDWFLGRLFEELKQQDLWENTLIIVTSDHGEEFADHRPGKFYNVHCDSLYDEITRVPLIIRAPGRSNNGSIVRNQVRLVDVVPTILELLGLATPSQMQGRSLVELIEGRGPAAASGHAYSEALCIGPEWKSLRTQRYKYMVGFAEDKERVGIPGDPQWELLFDLIQDPGETENLAPSERRLVDNMRSRLVTFFSEEALPK